MPFLMPIINALFGGALQSLLKSWLDYKASTAATKEAGFALAVAADQANLAAVASAEIQIDAMKVQVYGTPTYRIVTLLVGVPVAIHFSLVFIDTILASGFLFGRPLLGVPNPPGEYPTFEWAIVASFFLVHAVGVGTSNVARWMK